MAVLLFGQRKSVLRPFLCRDERTPRFRSADGGPCPRSRGSTRVPHRCGARFRLYGACPRRSAVVSCGSALPGSHRSRLACRATPRWLSASSRAESLALPLESREPVGRELTAEDPHAAADAVNGDVLGMLGAVLAPFDAEDRPAQRVEVALAVRAHGPDRSADVAHLCRIGDRERAALADHARAD